MKQYEKYKDSTVAWLGQVPEHWNDVRLASCFSEAKDTNKDNEFNRAFQFKYGNIVYKKDTPIDVETIATFKKYAKVSENDIVVNGLNLNYDFLTQRVAIVPQRGIITSAYIAMTPRETVVPKFACYLLKGMDETKLLNGMGTGIRLTLSFGELKKQYIPYPSIAEQEQIVRYLDWKVAMADTFVRDKKREIALLRELRQAEINRAVTRGLDLNAPTRPSGIDWIGENPAHWELVRLKNRFYLQNNRCSNIGQANYIGLENIESWSGRKIESGIDIEGVSSSFKKDNVLFGKLRPYLAKAYLADCDGICSTELLVYDIIKDNPQYARIVMTSNWFIDRVNSSTYGAKMPRANSTFIGNIQIPFPPIDEQQQIVIHIQKVEERINKAIEEIEKQIALVAEFKTSLISDVTTGKIDIRGIKIPDYQKEELATIEEDNEEIDE